MRDHVSDLVFVTSRCIANIKDECAHDYGGCWRGDFTVNGQKKTYHACHDNIDIYKASSSPILLLAFCFVYAQIIKDFTFYPAVIALECGACTGSV